MVTGNDVVIKARQLIGYPYVYGGSSPSNGGFDCSGLVQYSYKQVGISIPRTTYDQVKIGKKITNKADLIAGDLIFNFDNYGVAQHVFLYSGNGKVIEAKYTGTFISEHSAWTWQGQAVRVIVDSTPQPITPPPPIVQPQQKTMYRVIAGSYTDRVNAEKQQKLLEKSGFACFIAIYNDKVTYYRVVVGSYSDKSNAEKRQSELLKAGYASFLLVYKA
ncbi:MAG: NlpC/P60 family protein [Clostridium sp.]